MKNILKMLTADILKSASKLLGDNLHVGLSGIVRITSLHLRKTNARKMKIFVPLIMRNTPKLKKKSILISASPQAEISAFNRIKCG